MAIQSKFNSDDASYIVALATPEASRARTLYKMDGNGFFTALKNYFGEAPIQMYVDSLFKGVDPSTLPAPKKRVYDAVFQNADISMKNQITIVNAVISRMPIGKEYIQNIPHAQTKDLVAVGGAKFVDALSETYGSKAVQSANQHLFSMSDSSYTGAKEFKERYSAAIRHDTALSPDDQKYVQNYVQYFV